jgi:hypothetical protein
VIERPRDQAVAPRNPVALATGALYALQFESREQSDRAQRSLRHWIEECRAEVYGVLEAASV